MKKLKEHLTDAVGCFVFAAIVFLLLLCGCAPSLDFLHRPSEKAKLEHEHIHDINGLPHSDPIAD